MELQSLVIVFDAIIQVRLMTCLRKLHRAVARPRSHGLEPTRHDCVAGQRGSAFRSNVNRSRLEELATRKDRVGKAACRSDLISHSRITVVARRQRSDALRWRHARLGMAILPLRIRLRTVSLVG